MSREEEKARQVRREHNRFVKQKAKAHRELRQKVIAAFQEGVIQGKDEEVLRGTLMERFDLTRRRVDNILDKRAEVANPKAQALTEAKMLVHLERMERDIIDIRDDCDTQLDRLDEAEQSDQEWFDLEVTETVGGKEGNKTVTKRLPIIEARLRLYERKADALNRYFNAVKALRGGTQILNILTVPPGHADMTMTDIDEKIRLLERQQRVSGGDNG